MKSGSIANNQVQKSPDTLLKLIFLILKSFIKGLPRLIKRSIIKLVIIFLAVLIFNTYLLVVKNEGFSPTSGNKWLDITSLQGNIGWATTFWTFAMFFITAVLGRIKTDGLKKFLTDVFTSPGFFVKKMKESGNEGLPALLITTTVILLITLLVKNKGSMVLYFLIAYLSFTKQGSSFMVSFFALLKSDLNKLLRKKAKINQATLFMMGAGVSIAFLIACFVKKPLFVILISVALAGLYFYSKSKKNAVKAMIFAFVFLGMNYVLYKNFGRVYADDGGWLESGGTLSGWIGSQGAGTAIGMGVSPAAGGLIGALIGWTYNGIDVNSILPDASIFDDLSSSSDYDVSNDGAISDIVTNDATNDAVNNDTGIGEVDDSTKITTQGDGTSLDDQVDYTNILGNFLGLDSVGDGLKSGLKSLFDNTDDFAGYMKDMVKNSKIYDYVSDVLQGDPKSRLSWLKNSFESMKNSKVEGYLNALKGGLAFVGIGVDAYDNVNQGDEIVTAVSKSMATNATVFLAGETSGGPTLALWEMGNHLLFGGSKASDIGSPVKLIKGGMNWMLDASGGMDPKQLASRMDSGYYGENIRNLYYGSDMVKDFVKDPGSFYDEVGDFTSAGGQGWKDMNKTADDIFKLPDNVNEATKDLYSTDALKTIWNSPLDSTRRFATDSAHLATKAAVKVGEGWAYIGESLGTASVEIEQKGVYNYIKSFF